MGGAGDIFPNPDYAAWLVEYAAWWTCYQVTPAGTEIDICGHAPAEPDEFIQAELRFDASASLELNIAGTFRAEGGSVAVTYPTAGSVEALNIHDIHQGDVFAIRTAEIPGTPAMTTDFAEMHASLRTNGVHS